MDGTSGGGHSYALLTIGGLESIATSSLVDEYGVQRSCLTTLLPGVSPTKEHGTGAGLGVIIAETDAPLTSQTLASPCVCTALSIVLQHDMADADDLASICSYLSQGWLAAMKTLKAHAAVSDSPTFRVASVRIGRHDFDSRAMNACIADAAGLLQPTWTVNLETPDVCLCCVLVHRALLVGLLLPPYVSRKSTPLPVEPREWLIAGVERPHMRPARAACLVRMAAPKAGEVLLDPTGGLGLLAIEAALLANVRAYSLDVDSAACDAARENATAAAPRLLGTVHVHCADATRLLAADCPIPMPLASVDCVVADLPFGMVHSQRLDVGQLLLALSKLLKLGGRCLLTGNAGNGGVAAAVVKASKRFPQGAWRVDSQTEYAAGGIPCMAVALTLIAQPSLGAGGRKKDAATRRADVASSDVAAADDAAVAAPASPTNLTPPPPTPAEDAALPFDTLVAAVHAAELLADEHVLRSALAAVARAARRAPDAWRSPFTADSFCRDHLLAPCPAAFWRRLSRKFPAATDAIGAASAALAEEDLLDISPAETITVGLGADVAIELVEGTYATGGIGRHVYAAATALGTLLVQEQHDARLVPAVHGRRVLELGCGVGLVGLAAVRCGASSVVMTDVSDASVACATANAARHGLADGGGARAAPLDWSAFATAAGGEAACANAGLGGEEGWWPDVILGADCCYSDVMGDALIAAIAHLLAAAPPTARACIVNGWPNRGLERLETLLGARATLAAQEQAAREAGERGAPRRPFVDVADGTAGACTEGVVPSPRGLETIELVSAERITGFADHAHHVYVLKRAM